MFVNINLLFFLNLASLIQYPFFTVLLQVGRNEELPVRPSIKNMVVSFPLFHEIIDMITVKPLEFE